MRIPHPADPFPPPDWRHARCEYLAREGKRPSRRDDGPTRAGRSYLRALLGSPPDRARARAARRYPELDAAYRLRTGPDLPRVGVEGYLLAGVAAPDIEARFSLHPGAARSYAEQFFDVGGRLDAPDHLANVVLGLHARPLDETDAATFVRLFGLAHGPRAVDDLLDYFAHPPPLTASFDGLCPGERVRLRRRLRVRIAILARCLPEQGVSPVAWRTLEGLVERLGRPEPSYPAGLRLDVDTLVAAASGFARSEERQAPPARPESRRAA